MRNDSTREQMIVNIEQTVINDRDGSLCGFDHEERCKAVRDGRLHVLHFAAGNCADSLRRMKVPRARLHEIDAAAQRLIAYYRQHVTELEEMNTAHRETSIVGRENGRAIRRVDGFRQMFSVDGSKMAFPTLEDAERYARELKAQR